MTLNPLYHQLVTRPVAYDGPPRTRRKLSLSDDTYRRLQYAALRSGLSVSDVAEFLVREVVPAFPQEEDHD